MEFMLIHCIDEAAEPAGGDAAEDPAIVRERDAWDAEMEARGIKKLGVRLRPASDATTVRVRDGQVLITDGPFAETKEQVAGINVLDCADLAEALQVAARHPTARTGTFELRPFWP